MQIASTRISSLGVWLLASHCATSTQYPTSIEESVSCTLFITISDQYGKPVGRGSGFVAVEGGKQWVYTNAHVIAGGTRIAITTLDGKKLRKFGQFQCFDQGAGDINLKLGERTVRFGGDGVRIELLEPQEFAFAMAPRDWRPVKATKIVTIGDNDGDRSMEVLEGEVLSNNGEALLSTCKTRPGSSGGAVLDRQSFSVIGVNTWGVPSGAKAIDLLWVEKGRLVEDAAGCSLLKTANWVSTTIGSFLQATKEAEKLRQIVRTMSIVYATTPTKSGMVLDESKVLGGGRTIGQVLKEGKSNEIIRSIVTLNEKLKRNKTSNLQTANMEIVRVYAKALRKIRKEFNDQYKEIKGKLPYFHQLELANGGVYAVGRKCYDSLDGAADWFGDIAGTGGRVPLGGWIDLPAIRDF